LFDSLPDHPQKISSELPARRVADRMRLLVPLLKPHAVYLEVGCGNAALPFAIASFARKVLGLDVTEALIDFAAAPSNFRFVKTEGVEIPLADSSVDLAHSDQLMEHLHTEDAEPQLREINRILKPGGRYLCATPSRVTGPHDISVFFDEVATGFHMREYDYRSLRDLFLKTGFSRVRFPLMFRGFRLATPPYPVLRWRCRPRPLVSGGDDSPESSWGSRRWRQNNALKRTDDVGHWSPEHSRRAPGNHLSQELDVSGNSSEVGRS
jgi:SAM-dependent methyltransferase